MSSDSISYQSETDANAKTPSKQRGCLRWILYILASGWIILLSILATTTIWIIEQGLFDGSLAISDFRWIVSLVYSLMIIIPFAVAAYFATQKKDRRVFFMWTLSGLLALLFTPTRLVSIVDSQFVSLIQLFVLFINILLLNSVAGKVFNKKINFSIDFDNEAGIIMIMSAILILPWALWGAFGSIIDIIFSILNGIFFGINAYGLIQIGISPSFTANSEDGNHRHQFIFPGYFSSLALIIMVTGFALNGNQWLLFITIPILGLIAAESITMARREQKSAFLAVVLLIGFSVMNPLMWIDSDELMMVTSIGDGELFQTAFRIILFTFGIEFFFTIAFLFRKWLLGKISFKKRTIWIAAALTWLAAVILYWFAGNPGLYGERLFVVLNSQADLTEYSGIDDVEVRREMIYQEMVEHANETQTGLIKILERAGISYKSFYLVNGLEVRGGPILRLWLENQPEVSRVLDNPYLRPLPEEKPVESGQYTIMEDDILWSQKNIRADLVWYELNVTGKGVVIGQSDSGVQGDHPELSDSYKGIHGDDDYHWYDPWYGSEKPVDHGSHGTHTLGSILGNNVGIAPDAEWIGCVNLGRNLGNPALYLECMQFMLAPFPQGGNALEDGVPSLGADILNNSWGCPEVEGCDAEIFLPAVRVLREAGVFVVASAGNSGYSGCGSVDAPPAIYDEVYTVGSINQNDRVSDFSSLGPVEIDGSMRIKPDILAPGEDVFSSYPENTYEIASGTSMAGPHVVGVVALMWSASPELIGNIDLTEEILNKSARQNLEDLPVCSGDASDYPNNAAGYGIVDAYAAVKMALEYHEKK